MGNNRYRRLNALLSAAVVKKRDCIFGWELHISCCCLDPVVPGAYGEVCCVTAHPHVRVPDLPGSADIPP